MFSSLGSALTPLIVLAIAVVLIAGLAEGRGTHLLRILLRLDERRGMDHVYDEVQREDAQWEIFHEIDSEPEAVSGGERAATWARGATRDAKDVAQHARVKFLQLRENAEESPVTTGEIILPRR